MLSLQALKTYYYLTKPGIIYGNLMTAAAGFLLAAQGDVDFKLMFYTLLGIGLVIASACVFNNYVDRDIDARMTRTKNRAFVRGTVSFKAGFIYGSSLVLLGIVLLITFTNLLAVISGLIGWSVYIFGYSISKRLTVHSTVIGSITGAMPIVAGYLSVTNKVDSGAILLFLILVCWQMPHFYAIAIRRISEYRAAKLPVMPIRKGIHKTKSQILLYILGFVLSTSLLFLAGYTGYLYLTVMLIINLYWFYLAIMGFKTKDNTVWARKMFLYSLIVLLTFSILIAVNAWVV